MMNSILSASIFLIFVNAATATSCNSTNYNELDLMIVLDGSSSVQPENFLKMLEFVKEVISQLHIANNATNIGIVQYSYWIKTDIELRAHDSKDSLLTAVDGIRYHNIVGTSTGAAIKRATDTFDDNVRPGVARAMVVITDGYSDDHIVAEAKRARQNGIQMIAVGVSEHVDGTQLLQIVNGDKSRAFKLENFENLSAFVYKLTERIRQTTNEKCYKQIEDVAKTELSADKPTTNALLIDNDVIKFTCTMTPTSEDMRYIWFKDGTEIQSNEAITMENGLSCLTITIERLDQAGAYSCKGVHPFGIAKDGDKTITLTVSQIELKNECKTSQCDTEGMEHVKKVTTFVEKVNKLLLNMAATFKDCL